ncbi:MAG: glycosyltransferase [Polyangiales bacterium]
MKVGIYTWGSEGDIRPFLALALGLERAGHEVALGYVAVDGRDYGPLASSLGLEARAVAVDAIARARAEGDESDEALAGKGHPMKQIETVLAHLLDPAVDAMWEDAASTLPGCDVALVHLLHHPAASLALAHRIPIVALQPVPVWPTRALPPMGAPDLGRLNRLTWWVASKVGGSFFLPRVNASRARAGVPLETTMFPRPNPAAMTLTCVSPTLVPRPDDWDDFQRVPGFFEIPADAQGWALPSELRAFLDAGEPPLLMGFGSMLAIPNDDTKHCVRVLVEAASLAGCRALVQAPWELLPDVETPPNVFRLGRAPHALVLPHCSAFVHHGGAGTTHTACLAGKPSVIVPFLGDQFFWAERLRSLGIAKAPVPRRSLTAAKLAKAIRALLADPRAFERARAIGRAMAEEEGVSRAVGWIEEVRRGR